MQYLQIYRPLNVVFIILAQWLSAYFLDFSSTVDALEVNGIYWLMLGSASLAFYGYWLNDFLDQKRDSINKHDGKYVSKLNPLLVYVHLLLFVSVILYSNQFLPGPTRLVLLGGLLLLTVYNVFLKNVAGVGNLIIGMLAFAGVFVVIYQFPSIDVLLLLHFSIISGVLTIGREIVKDAEDIEGDMATEAKTIPVIMGLKNANTIIYMLVLFSISFVIISLYYQQAYLKKPLLYVYYAYYACFVVVPLYYVSMQTRQTLVKEDYSRLSLYLKYILFTGVLSILFF